MVKEILIPATDRENILIRASEERRSFNVQGGRVDGRPVKEDIPALLGSGDFTVVPLCSPDRIQGVLIADNFITRQKITAEDVSTMELFANQAVLAIEKSKLYSELASRLKSLEAAHEELQASRELLVRVERLSALGEMAAQIAHEIISVCLNSLEAQLSKQQVELVRHFSSDIPAVQADENQIKEVLLNLLRNAVEAMPSGGRLRVATRWESEEIIIDIEGSGPGLSVEELELARRPFFTTKAPDVAVSGMANSTAKTKLSAAFCQRIPLRFDPLMSFPSAV
jgi:signal transduction histidine kinase